MWKKFNCKQIQLHFYLCLCSLIKILVDPIVKSWQVYAEISLRQKDLSFVSSLNSGLAFHPENESLKSNMITVVELYSFANEIQ